MANWFGYLGIGDPSLAGSYKRSLIKPTCISGGCKVCAIYLDDNSSSSPSSIDANVLFYITHALVTQVSQPPGAVKRFLYVRTC